MLELVKYTHDSEMNSQARQMLDAIGVKLPLSSINFVSERRTSVALDEDSGREYRLDIAREIMAENRVMG